MIEFLIDSPSSRSASLAMNSSLSPDWSTPTKSLCSAGEKKKKINQSINRQCLSHKVIRLCLNLHFIKAEQFIATEFQLKNKNINSSYTYSN